MSWEKRYIFQWPVPFSKDKENSDYRSCEDITSSSSKRFLASLWAARWAVTISGFKGPQGPPALTPARPEPGSCSVGHCSPTHARGPETGQSLVNSCRGPGRSVVELAPSRGVREIGCPGQWACLVTDHVCLGGPVLKGDLFLWDVLHQCLAGESVGLFLGAFVFRLGCNPGLPLAPFRTFWSLRDYLRLLCLWHS